LSALALRASAIPGRVARIARPQPCGGAWADERGRADADARLERSRAVGARSTAARPSGSVTGVPVDAPAPPVTLADVEAARDRIAGAVRRTPVIRAAPLREPPGTGDLWLKLEGLQVTGSFKARGAVSK